MLSVNSMFRVWQVRHQVPTNNFLLFLLQIVFHYSFCLIVSIYNTVSLFVQNKLEFENIKMDRDVSMKTGFRRHIYGRKRPPLEKETKEQRRQAELKYPWDYTTDNMFRPRKKKPKNSKDRVEERKRNDHLPMWLKSQRVEPTPPKDPYPEHDPFGLYRPREKKEHKDYSGCLAAKKYEDMSVREMLANMKAKAASMPVKRDMSRDVDTLMEDMCKPIQRSKPIEYVALDDYDPNWEYSPEPGLDDRTKSKIQGGRGDLAEFERLLDAKFGRKGKGASYQGSSQPPPLQAPSRIPPKVDLAAGMRELEVIQAAACCLECSIPIWLLCNYHLIYVISAVPAWHLMIKAPTLCTPVTNSLSLCYSFVSCPGQLLVH